MNEFTEAAAAVFSGREGFAGRQGKLFPQWLKGKRVGLMGLTSVWDSHLDGEADT